MGPGDAFTAYGLVAAVSALLALGAASAARRSRPRLVALGTATALTVLHLSWLAPLLIPDRRPAADSGHVTVLALNAQFGEADPGQLMQAAGDADVVVITEQTRPLQEALNALGWSDRFPYDSGQRLPRAGALGTAVYSRFPITATAPMDMTTFHQNWVTRVEVPGVGEVAVFAVHPARPRDQAGSRWADEHAQLLAAVRSSTLPTVVAGDFNATESQAPLRRLRAAGFRTSTDLLGTGPQPTWPADSRRLPPVLGIDHVYVDPTLTALSSQTVRVTGTDHLGLRATLAPVD